MSAGEGFQRLSVAEMPVVKSFQKCPLWRSPAAEQFRKGPLSGTLLVRDSQQTGHCYCWARPGPRREGPLPGPGGEICWSERDQVKVKLSLVLWQERGLCWRHSAPFVAVGKGGFCWRPGLASVSLIGASSPCISSVQGSS